MSMQPQATPLPAPKPQAEIVRPPRKRKAPASIAHEDDDWLPQAAAPTRATSEFIENDYDLM